MPAAKKTKKEGKTWTRAEVRAGIRALGLAGQVGELNRHAFADLIALPFTRKRSEIYETVIYFAGELNASMIDGEWAITPK